MMRLECSLDNFEFVKLDKIPFCYNSVINLSPLSIRNNRIYWIKDSYSTNYQKKKRGLFQYGYLVE